MTDYIVCGVAFLESGEGKQFWRRVSAADRDEAGGRVADAAAGVYVHYVLPLGDLGWV